MSDRKNNDGGLGCAVLMMLVFIALLALIEESFDNWFDRRLDRLERAAGLPENQGIERPSLFDNSGSVDERRKEP